MIALHYHQATKHHFKRFARSLGYLDWASQPDPFRRYAGAPVVTLSHDIVAAHQSYASLYEPASNACPIDERSIAEFLRCSMAVSAWKQYRDTRWALRVNPSSGNLHPTEAYVVRAGDLYHYVPREHALEHRARLDRAAWDQFTGGGDGVLVGLTSILWREAWKYGERAFRYCQHDTGHALAAMRMAAALLGWTLALLPRWSDSDLSTLCGLDRDDDHGEAEREEPELLAVVTSGDLGPWLRSDPGPLVAAARSATWQGTANRLSPDHVPWPIIDEVRQATRFLGVVSSTPNAPTPNSQSLPTSNAQSRLPIANAQSRLPIANAQSRLPIANAQPLLPTANVQSVRARDVIVTRRSAVAFDAKTGLARDSFFSMLARLRPGPSTALRASAPPWDAIDWPPQVHLILFVHRVEGLPPGLYACLREPAALDEWRASMRPEFLWERQNDPNSCDQDIAADGFFSLGMIARLEPALRERGEWFYRRLFWECGMIGQVLYLEAEAAGARGTGIGCFYDDAVHELLGLSDDRWQSLYHFSMGVPVEDTRLTTEPGYSWEAESATV